MSVYRLGSEVFTDVPSWADQYVGWASEAGITQGIGGGLFDSDSVLPNQQTGILTLRAYKTLVD